MKQNSSRRTANARPVHRRNTKNQPEEDSLALWIRHLSKSLAITALAALLFTLGSALIAYFTPDPAALVRPLGLVASALTACIGGFAAVRIHRHAALLCGLFNGSLATALMMLLSLFFTAHASGYSAGISALIHAAFILFSVAGAFLGLPKAEKRK